MLTTSDWPVAGFHWRMLFCVAWATNPLHMKSTGHRKAEAIHAAELLEGGPEADFVRIRNRESGGRIIPAASLNRIRRARENHRGRQWPGRRPRRHRGPRSSTARTGRRAAEGHTARDEPPRTAAPRCQRRPAPFSYLPSIRIGIGNGNSAGERAHRGYGGGHRAGRWPVPILATGSRSRVRRSNVLISLRKPAVPLPEVIALGAEKSVFLRSVLHARYQLGHMWRRIDGTRATKVLEAGRHPIECPSCPASRAASSTMRRCLSGTRSPSYPRAGSPGRNGVRDAPKRARIVRDAV